LLLALGLNIVVGYAGLLDLGYVAFFAVGAYLFALLGSPHLADAFPAIKAAFPQRAAFTHLGDYSHGGCAGRVVRCAAWRANPQAAR
jgi:ABC-type branched-subunit amino acid transport system permease subunit